MQREIIVVKFGSSVLRSAADLPNAVHEIYRWYRAGLSVVAVVSAIGEATDRLINQARELVSSPEPYALAELLATGERASAALLGVALDRSGVPARVLNPREIGLTVAGDALDSELIEAELPRLRALLSEYPVLVVPGFFGTDAAGRTHLLGRGGSDLTAVFLAHVLNAKRCRLIKDVDGVYESDPAVADGLPPRRFTSLSYADALAVASPLIQPKAVSFLRQYAGRAEVAAQALTYDSTVYGGPTELAPSRSNLPFKVLLLGLGTVGFGVYQCLLSNPNHFQVIGALVRSRDKHEAAGVPVELLYTNEERVKTLRPDVLVDALPAGESARRLVEHSLRLGVRVTSANKALIAEHGSELTALARESGGSLRYSAAVGGAAPMIEMLDRVVERGPLTAVTAVLNGTCNFVLDRCAEGATLEEAIAEAKREGFAEANPSEDLTGYDAERKLRILCRHGFDTQLPEVQRQILDEGVARRAREVSAQGGKLRQVARAYRVGAEVRAAVAFETVDADSALGRLKREWNGLEIRESGGQVHTVTGRGAGRWPTAESVMADLYDAHRAASRG